MPPLETGISTARFPDRHVAARIGNNTLFGILSNAARIGTRLITVPIVIHYLGLDGYGIWSIIMITAGYMRFGSAGIRSAFQKYVAEATGNGNYLAASRLISTGSISMLAISLSALIPFAVYAKDLAVAAGVPHKFLNAAAAAMVVLAAIYVVTNFGGAFEAIVMGGHRIDLTKKYSIVLTVCEAAVIVELLHSGYGLLAMTVTMGISELIYILFCYRAAHRVVPEMQISTAHFTKDVFPELLRFVGSYQLVNILELLSAAILPIVILKDFGAVAAGVLAVATRVITSALIAQEALVLPILSGGTVVFALGSRERSKSFFAKSFKVTLMASLPPLAGVAAFGPTIVLAWTGQVDHWFRMAIWLCALAASFKALAVLQLVLYRASGKAVLDNVWQLIRLTAILVVAIFSKNLGFEGVLGGIAGAELIGLTFMLVAMNRTFQAFSIRTFSVDAMRISTAVAMMVGAGAMAGQISIPWSAGERLSAAIKLGEIAMGCLMMAWPALALTKSVSSSEGRRVLEAISLRRKAVCTIGN
jgi:O-antigen/teichoic acid export membrane protein